MLDTKPDYEDSRRRMEAWWHGEVLDRALTNITLRRPDPLPPPAQRHASLRDRWMDADYASEVALTRSTLKTSVASCRRMSGITM